MNTTTGTNENNMIMIECSSCKQEIREDARKCKFCGAAQGRMNSANTISIYVGAIIAVTSLATLAIEAGKKLFDKEKASLTITVVDSSPESFNYVVSNKGSKPGVAYDLTVKYPPSMECSKGDVFFEQRLAADNKVIEPGKTYSFSSKVNRLYSVFAGFDPHALADKKLSQTLAEFKVCSATLTYLDFDSTHKSEEVKFHCVPQGVCPKTK